MAREPELFSHELKIGNVYRIEEYGPWNNHRLTRDPFLAVYTDANRAKLTMYFTELYHDIMPNFNDYFTILADTDPTHKYYYRFFDTPHNSRGGRKHKTRQTKLRRKNRTRKNRRR